MVTQGCHTPTRRKGFTISRSAGLGTIVRGENDNGVFVLVALNEVVQQAAQVVIHGLYHGRVNRHAFSLEAALIRAQGIPVGRSRHALHADTLWNDAELSRPQSALLPEFIPAAIINTHVTVNKFLRRLHRDMYRLEWQVGEEGATVIDIAVDELDSLVDQEAGGVEILGQLVLLAVGIPISLIVEWDIRPLLPVVGARIRQCHGTLKTSLAGQLPGGGAQVPLPRHIRMIASSLQ